MIQIILTNLLLGVVGILFYTLLESKKYFLDNEKTWNFSIFLSENLKTWLYIATFILIAAVLSGISPDLLSVFKVYLGIDFVDTPAWFFTLGLVLKSVLKK